MARPPRLISLSEFADRADVHPRSVRRWIASGLITGYRVGPRLVKCDPADLDRVVGTIPAANGGEPEPT